MFKTTRFVVSIYVLYELRHPSVFPDEKTKFKKASNASGDVSGEIKKATGPNEAAPNGGRGGRVGDVNDQLTRLRTSTTARRSASGLQSRIRPEAFLQEARGGKRATRSWKPRLSASVDAPRVP